MSATNQTLLLRDNTTSSSSTSHELSPTKELDKKRAKISHNSKCIAKNEDRESSESEDEENEGDGGVLFSDFLVPSPCQKGEMTKKKLEKEGMMDEEKEKETEVFPEYDEELAMKLLEEGPMPFIMPIRKSIEEGNVVIEKPVVGGIIQGVRSRRNGGGQ
ncbi:hypothetical protein G7Y89_g7971 [Cudoniella acicularis]|uniref:Uncharacterized protein n=1 Tax=Cudoniella acicularis TaxID=354080 RepID=A0A8H4RJH4_9HELO|nr:hypothetical protein G7Y89_g7971 [Cudoniella acicularis]